MTNKIKQKLFFISIFIVSNFVISARIYSDLIINGIIDGSRREIFFIFTDINTLIHTVILFIVAYALYQIIVFKEVCSKNSHYGRNWMAWTFFVATMLVFSLANVSFSDLGVLVVAIIVIILCGMFSFVLGLIYGNFKLKKLG